MRPNTTVKLLCPIIPSGINPTIGIGPTQGQRKTLTRVGFEPTTFELDLLIPDGIIGHKSFTVVLGLIRTWNHYSQMLLKDNN